MIGKTINHYEILEKLGQGGMGVVYKAEDTMLDRFVALKFLPVSFEINDEDQARFLQEAKAAAAINHPNVCTIFDFQEHDGQKFIVMEYIDGQTLRKAISDMGYGISETIEIAIQIGEALAAAHEKGIVHRDIKSDNIMITKSGQAKVMDFGLAKLKGSLKVTKTGSTVGTLSYMAPEYIQGGDADTRSDIFSMGVILYEMLTGELPFKGDYEAAQMYSILNEDPEPVKKRMPEIPSELLHILNRSLEKDPANRYQTVTDMLIDLRRLQREESRTTALFEGSEGKKKSLPGWVKWMVLAVFIVTIVVSAFFYFNTDADNNDLVSLAETLDNRSVIVLYFDNQTGDASMDHWREAITSLIISDLAQSRYLKVLSYDKLVDILTDLDKSEVTDYSAEMLVEIADQAKTRNVIYGSFTKAGDLIRINFTIKEPVSDQLLGTEMVEGRGEESIFGMVDQLTLKIKDRLNYSNAEIASDVDRKIMSVTTSSAEAYRYYLEGRKLFYQDKFRESIDPLEKAVAADSNFAMAYRALAASYSRLRYIDESVRQLEKAIEFSDKLPEREKWQIIGTYYYRKDLHKAIASYSKIIKLYPLNILANVNLGIIYFNNDQLAKAEEHFTNILLTEPSDLGANRFLAQTYFYMNKLDKMEALIKSFMEKYRQDAYLQSLLAEIWLTRNEPDRALEENAIAYKMDPDNITIHFDKIEYLMIAGRFDEARGAFDYLLDHPELSVRFRAFQRLIDLDLYQGMTKELERHCNSAQIIVNQTGESWMAHEVFYDRAKIDLLQKDFQASIRKFKEELSRRRGSDLLWLEYWCLHRLVHDNLAVGHIPEAKKYCRQIKTLYESYQNKNEIRRYLQNEGLVLAFEGNYTAAVDTMKKAYNLYSKMTIQLGYAYLHYDMAFIHYMNNNLPAAEKWFRKLLDLNRARLNSGHLYAYSLYHLGLIYDKTGQKEKAIDYFNRFLDLWKMADFDSPELKDARDRVKRLKA